VSPTAFDLLGIDRWVRNFRYVCFYDSSDGNHPSIFVPADRRAPEFTSIEDIGNYLLRHREVRDMMRAEGPDGLVTFVMFDSETEELARGLGLRVAHPPAELRHRLDSKIVTTQLGNAAGVPSVPNVLGRAASYAELLAPAAREGLGSDLVVQTPYGDSGKTTFFVRNEADWNASVAAEPLPSMELKVMRRIEHRAVAVEAVLTRHGTIVGPLMNDITGHPELTAYRTGTGCTASPRPSTCGCWLPVTSATGARNPRPAARHAGDPTAVARPDQGVVQAGLSAIRGRG